MSASFTHYLFIDHCADNGDQSDLLKGSSHGCHLHRMLARLSTILEQHTIYQDTIDQLMGHWAFKRGHRLIFNQEVDHAKKYICTPVPIKWAVTDKSVPVFHTVIRRTGILGLQPVVMLDKGISIVALCSLLLSHRYNGVCVRPTGVLQWMCPPTSTVS